MARVAGVLGGGCLLTRHLAVVEELRWPGLALLAVALAAAGSSLVSRSAAWLRLVVAVAVVLLVWSLLELWHQELDDSLVDAAVGVVAVLWALVSLAGRRRPSGRGSRAGSHAA